MALVAVDGLVHLYRTDANNKRTIRLRGIAGIGVATAAIFWPGKTAYIAVELIGLWAILVGVLELYVCRYSHYDAKDRVLLGFAAITSILMGLGVMIWAFVGAVVISATIGVASVARGITLVMSGTHERHQIDDKQAVAA